MKRQDHFAIPEIYRSEKSNILKVVKNLIRYRSRLVYYNGITPTIDCHIVGYNSKNRNLLIEMDEQQRSSCRIGNIFITLNKDCKVITNLDKDKYPVETVVKVGDNGELLYPADCKWKLERVKLHIPNIHFQYGEYGYETHSVYDGKKIPTETMYNIKKLAERGL